MELIMFKKSNSNNGLLSYDNASSPSTTNQNKSPSVLGPTLHIKGELVADEDLVIQGQVEGAIRHNQQQLTIGQQGIVKGDISANVITVEGTVVGNIHGEDAVMIKKSAKVEGDIRSRRIVIDDGAQFNGRIDMDTEQQRLAINSGGSNAYEIDSDSSIDADLASIDDGLDLESSMDTNNIVDDIAELDTSVLGKKTEAVND